VCIVRSSSSEDGKKRVFKNYGHYFNEEPPKQEKIRVLAGDLTKDKLGLKNEDWEQLTKEIDFIINNAAQVNGVLPYSVLRLPNLEGTKQICKLSVSFRTKLFVHISTLSVFNLGDKSLKENHPLLISSLDFLPPYAASKCAAEIFLNSLATRIKDFPLLIFRPVKKKILFFIRIQKKINSFLKREQFVEMKNLELQITTTSSINSFKE
jgi:myxalamid-type nonribosomal peptide synthetase MxaA